MIHYGLRERRGSWQVCRCIVSATQWCRESKVESQERAFILKNCLSLFLYCCTFSSHSPFFFFFFCFLFTVFSQISLCLPSCTTIFQHSPFFPAHSVLSPCHHLCCRCQLCCLVYWCDKSSNQTKASCVMQVTDSWKPALSPLLSSLSTDSYVLTLSLMSRSDWSWAKSHWWINGWWL